MNEALKVWNMLNKYIKTDEYPDLPSVSTPSPSVNWALEGGIKPGYHYCFEGVESSGKSFFALACMASLLRANPDAIVLWFDTEYAYSTYWQNKLMTPEEAERIKVIKVSTGPEIFDFFGNTVVDIIENQGGKVCGVVLDSLQSLVAPKEAKAVSTADTIMGDLSQYLPKAMKAVIPPIRKHGIPWITIAQVRHNFDQDAKYTGIKWTISGGQAFKHHIDVEVAFEKTYAKDSRLYSAVKGMNDQLIQVGHTVRVKIKKGRGIKPYRIAEFKLDTNTGIVEVEQELMKLAANLGVITRRGSSYVFKDQTLGIGKDKTIEAIRNSSELKSALAAAIMAAGDGIATSSDLEGVDAVDLAIAEEELE